MGVYRADSTAKRKRPSTPLPNSQPTREAAGSLQREWWQLTRPTLSYHLHYLCRDLLVTFSTSGFFPSPPGLAALPWLVAFFSPYLHTHTQSFRTLWNPVNSCLSEAARILKSCVWGGFALLFSVDFSQLSTLNICWVFFKALPNSGISFFIFFVDLNIKSGLLQTFTNTTVLSLPPSDPLIFVFYIYCC